MACGVSSTITKRQGPIICANINMSHKSQMCQILIGNMQEDVLKDAHPTQTEADPFSNSYL